MFRPAFWGTRFVHLGLRPLFSAFLGLIFAMSLTHRRSASVAQHQGFTLIEVMVVVAIISILAAIAIPSYDQYVKKSKAQAAAADLISLSLVLENEFAKKLNYPKTIANIQHWQPSQSNEFTYLYKGENMDAQGNPQTYEITGTAKNFNCTLKLNHINVRNKEQCSYLSNW